MPAKCSPAGRGVYEHTPLPVIYTNYIWARLGLFGIYTLHVVSQREEGVYTHPPLPVTHTPTPLRTYRMGSVPADREGQVLELDTLATQLGLLDGGASAEKEGNRGGEGGHAGT
jgi:hypothetical protein